MLPTDADRRNPTLQALSRTHTILRPKNAGGIKDSVPIIPMLRVGQEAGDSAGQLEVIGAPMRTGRPLASAEWIADAEAAMKRKLGTERRGPKPKR